MDFRNLIGGLQLDTIGQALLVFSGVYIVSRNLSSRVRFLMDMVLLVVIAVFLICLF